MTGDGNLSKIGNVGGATPASVGSATRVKGPKKRAIVSAPPKVTGQVRDAETVVAGLRGAFRRCYMLGLNDYPDMAGSVQVRAKLGPNGEVQSIHAQPNGTITSSVASCVASRVRTARFAPPVGGTATVVIPVKLVQAEKQ
jgi:hypothetical protein